MAHYVTITLKPLECLISSTRFVIKDKDGCILMLDNNYLFVYVFVRNVYGFNVFA